MLMGAIIMAGFIMPMLMGFIIMAGFIMLPNCALAAGMNARVISGSV